MDKKNNEEKNKITKKSQKLPPHTHKTVHVHNYFTTTNKKTKKTRNFSVQTPTRGIGWDGKARTFRNRIVQTEPDLPPRTDTIADPLISQMKILEALSEFNKINDLLSRFIYTKNAEEEAEFRKGLEDLFAGFFASEKDLRYKIDNCFMSFEFTCWCCFVNNYFHSQYYDGTIDNEEELLEIFTKKLPIFYHLATVLNESQNS